MRLEIDRSRRTAKALSLEMVDGLTSIFKELEFLQVTLDLQVVGKA